MRCALGRGKGLRALGLIVEKELDAVCVAVDPDSHGLPSPPTCTVHRYDVEHGGPSGVPLAPVEVDGNEGARVDARPRAFRTGQVSTWTASQGGAPTGGAASAGVASGGSSTSGGRSGSGTGGISGGSTGNGGSAMGGATGGGSDGSTSGGSGGSRDGTVEVLVPDAGPTDAPARDSGTGADAVECRNSITPPRR